MAGATQPFDHRASGDAYPTAGRLDVLHGDLRDREAVVAACEDADVVFHTGAVVGTSGPWDRYCAANSWATRYVVDGCLKHHVGALIFTSCVSVVFDARVGSAGFSRSGPTQFDETATHPARWLSHYTHTKALAERQVHSGNGLEGLRTCVLRLPLVWGPGDRHFLPWLLRLARSGRLRRIGDGANVIDTIYVENAAEAHLLAADALLSARGVRSSGFSRSHSGQTYFVAQDEPLKCWPWIDRLLSLAGLPPIAESVSLERAWRAAAVQDFLWRIFRRKGDPSLSRLRVAELGQSYGFDVAPARRDLGYSPRISTDEGLRRLAAEF
jgi:nucleoside-diphosphate-sugar epimerase